jgi:hypothetical protein
MELGDKVKAVTEAVGVKQCSECKKRQNLLNIWSRRGFIGGSTAALSYLTLVVKLKAQSVFVLPDNSSAVQLLRAVSTIQTAAHDNGGYVTKGAIIARLLETQHSHAHEEGDTGEWARSLNLESDDIMPGWSWDYSSKADGFLVIAAATAENVDMPRAVYVLDENNLIHRAEATGKVPRASSIRKASDFPGAEPYDSFLGPERQSWASRLFLRMGLVDTVKAAGRCANNTACCLCCGRNGGSCGDSHSGCFFACASSDCKFCQIPGGSFCCCPCCKAACTCGAGGVCANCKCCVCNNNC